MQKAPRRSPALHMVVHGKVESMMVNIAAIQVIRKDPCPCWMTNRVVLPLTRRGMRIRDGRKPSREGINLTNAYPGVCTWTKVYRPNHQSIGKNSLQSSFLIIYQPKPITKILTKRPTATSTINQNLAYALYPPEKETRQQQTHPTLS